MKKIIFAYAVTTLFMAGTMLTSCQSEAQKVNKAEEKVQDAKEGLKDAQNDANAAAVKAANAEEWRIFKSETEIKIKDNEMRITELKGKKKTAGKVMDAAYEKNIVMLEERNKALETRMTDYEKGQSDWGSFKREFNHDMDELGAALKDLTVNNKK